MIKSQAFSRHVFLNYKLHSYFLFPLLLFMWGRMAGVSGVGYFPSPTWKKRAARGGYLFFYSWVGFYLNSFTCGQTLLRRTECSGIFQDGSFPPLAECTRGFFFSDIYCNDLLELQEVKLIEMWGPLKWLCHLEIVSFKLVHTEPPAIHQLQFKISYPSAGFHGDFCSQVSVPVSCDSLGLSVMAPILRPAICPVTLLLWWM